ncbi:MAG: histidinol dehydrogenase [Chloroflexi bacterium]|nr:histidinol dehydrogenase [Chloroflexota bacterium]MDA1175139.1 histidinol dehydrogenase [Chloroflexota bacterium]
MRIVEGLQAGLALLARTPGYDEPELSPTATKRTADLFGEPLTATQAVRRILDDVRLRGDDGVREYARRIDRVELEELEIPRDRWREALASIPVELADALRVAADRVRDYHEKCMPLEWRDDEAGYGQRLVPIERVGLYVPGGIAEYPSTVLMSAIPAKVAGVPEVILCTPSPSPATLAAAEIADVDRLFEIGGAQAIGAMAFGTSTVPKVDKICGPGNIFVSIAKREVYGHVDIDGLYGPTETVVIADDTADASLAAADLLAQAEHDEMASPVLITTSMDMAQRVSAEVDRQLALLDRKAVASAAIEGQGMAVVVSTVEEAIELSDAFAPEHLCLLVERADSYVELVHNAGGIFVGEYSPEVMGDYVAGPSHAMPTAGTSRYASSLGVHHFLKHVPVIRLSTASMGSLGPAAAAIARAEGLTGHARAVEMRLEGAGTAVDKDFFAETPDGQ